MLAMFDRIVDASTLPCLAHGSETISREDLKWQLLQSSSTTLEQIMKHANVRHLVAPASPGRKQPPRGAGSRETQPEGYFVLRILGNNLPRDGTHRGNGTARHWPLE